MSQISAEVEVCICFANLPHLDLFQNEKTFRVSSPPTKKHKNYNNIRGGGDGIEEICQNNNISCLNKTKISAGYEQKVWRHSTVMLKDEGLRMGGEIYPILNIANVIQQRSMQKFNSDESCNEEEDENEKKDINRHNNKDAAKEEKNCLCLRKSSSSCSTNSFSTQHLICKTPETESTMGSSPSVTNYNECEIEENENFEEDEEYDFYSDIEKETNNIQGANSSESNNDVNDCNNYNKNYYSFKQNNNSITNLIKKSNRNSFLDLISSNNNKCKIKVNKYNRIYKVILVYVQGEDGNTSIKTFRYEKANKKAEKFVCCLNKVINFITDLRVFFTNLRHGVEEADALRCKYKQIFNQKLKQVKNMHSLKANMINNKESNFKQEKNEIENEKQNKMLNNKFSIDLTEKEKNILRVGLGLQELSMLEEAIAYCPLTACIYLKNLCYLKEISYEGHRSRNDVLALKSSYENIINGIINNKGEKEKINSDNEKSNVTADDKNTKKINYNFSTNFLKDKIMSNNNKNRINNINVNTCCFSPIKLFSIYGGQWRESKYEGHCEDATFVLNDECAIGIFDGVGSWALEGIDASKFSIGMAECCIDICKEISLKDEEEKKKLCCVYTANNNGELDKNTISRNNHYYCSINYNISNTNISLKAKNILKKGHQHLIKSKPYAWGSSTAVVAVLDKFTGKLGVACLGDSVLMILRRSTAIRQNNNNNIHDCSSQCTSFQQNLHNFSSESTSSLSSSLTNNNHHINNSNDANLILKPRMKTRNVVYRTKEQRWYNGAPYQLANLPQQDQWEELRERGYEKFVNTLHQVDSEGDSPDQASIEYKECQPGDLILLMTDGVSDNLFDDEIAAICSFAIDPEEAAILGNEKLFTHPQHVAKTITNAALRRSYDQVYSSAFVPLKMDRARRRHHEEALYNPHNPSTYRRGGKRDDISCVACWVICETEHNIHDYAMQYANSENSKSETLIMNKCCDFDNSNANILCSAASINKENDEDIVKIAISNNGEEKIEKFNEGKTKEEEEVVEEIDSKREINLSTSNITTAFENENKKRLNQINTNYNKSKSNDITESVDEKTTKSKVCINNNMILRNSGITKNRNFNISSSSAPFFASSTTLPANNVRVYTPKSASQNASSSSKASSPTTPMSKNDKADSINAAQSSNMNFANDNNKNSAVISSFVTSSPITHFKNQAKMTPLRKNKSTANQRFLEASNKMRSIFVGTPAKSTPKKNTDKSNTNNEDDDYNQNAGETNPVENDKRNMFYISDASDVESPYNADMTPRKCRRITRMYKNSRTILRSKKTGNDDGIITSPYSCRKKLYVK